MSRGGLYNKLGLYYEIEWTIRQILYIHSGKFDSIYLEHPLIDDKFEFKLKSSDRIEYHQVKRQRDEGTWTFKKLEKYIKTFYEIYKQNKTAHFIFVSTTSATELWNLRDRIGSSDSFESFNQDKSKKMSDLINAIKKSLNQSDEEVYYFFQNLNFHSEDEKLMEDSNCSYIKSNFKEDTKTVHNFLSSYIEENIGKKITRNQILSELNKFKPYHINPTDPDKIQEINKDFITKIKLKTATFIQRTEINKVKKAIKNKENIIILGDGGVGKSTFIRQIIEDIDERTYFVLDLEGFDFNGKNNFHEALGLDNPIEFTLSKYENSLVIIDQIDFLSFINSDNITLTLNKFLRDLEFNSIPYIITCRNFSCKTDHLNKLISNCKPNPTEITLKPFNNKQIDEFLKRRNINTIDSKTKKFLSIPLHLNLLCDLDTPSNCQLENTNELYYKYCQLTRENYNEKYNDWNDLLKYIFNYMETNETYHIPLHHHYFKAGLDYLSSEGVLIKTENGYIFCHEKVSDYFYTLNFKNNKENLESFLIDNKQTLYLRKFVKILLEFEKEENYDKYINISQELLESNKIRIHLKIFILDILNNTSEIKKEFTILKDFIKNSDNDLYYAVWDRIYKNPETWFKYFNKNNLIEKYKNKELNNEITPLLIYNKSNPETAKLFLDNLNKSEKWNEDAMLFIQFAPISNEKSFNLLIRLIKENIYSSKFNKLEDYYNDLFMLRELSSNQFIEVLHEFMNNILENEKFDTNDLKSIHSYSDDVFFNNISDDKDCSLRFIKKILPLMIKISDLNGYKNKDNGLKEDFIWKSPHRINYNFLKTENGNEEIYHPKTFDERIVNCMISCLTNIYHDNLEEFNKIKETLVNSNIDLFLEILLEIYTCSDSDKQSICSIIINEKFFELILYPEFIKTNIKLLENDEKEKLEKQILEYFKNKTNKSEIEYGILENIENPSEMTKNRIQELDKRKQKFNTNTNTIDSFQPILSVKEVENFTDDDWLNIFNKYNNSMSLYPFMDTTPQSFFVVLMELSKKDPLRFIELIEHINEETHKDYYNAILYGVSKSEIDFNNSLRLCRRCHSLQYKPCGKGIIDVLSNFPEKLDKECIDIINYYLIEDPDPSRETEKQNYLNNDIESDGLNSVRGYTADMLGHIFYHNQELVRLFEHSLKKLVKDPCISVRAMAAHTLIHIQDNDLKIELFKELININEDKILETKRVKKFLLDNIYDNFHELEYLIERMINSENPKINEYIGEIITFYSLRKYECDSYLEVCLNENKHTKIGILNAILHYVKEINNDMIEKIIEKLIKEDDKEIKELISLSMGKISENTIDRNEELLTKFVKSKNNYNYYYMLHNFNKIIKYDTTIILDLLEIIVIKLQDESLRELTRGRGIISECSDLILKIYTKTKENKKLRIRCLDLIDNILKLPETNIINNKIEGTKNQLRKR